MSVFLGHHASSIHTQSWCGFHPSRRCPVDYVDFGNPPPAQRIANDVDDDVQARAGLSMNGVTTQTSGNAQSLEPSWNVHCRVGMKRPTTPFVSGIEGRQEIDHFSATNLAHDDTVWPHA
jgi:hypothetical protein